MKGRASAGLRSAFSIIFVGTIFAGAAAFCAACAAPSDAPDNAHALSDIRTGRSHDEVVVHGIVTAIFPAEQGPAGVHERFAIRIADGSARQDIEVADNITVGKPAPIRAGDDVVVKGVLELDPSGPVIHWTHHDPSFRHPPGFIQVGGKKYD